MGRITRALRKFYKTSLKVKASLIVMALLLIPLFYAPWFQSYTMRGGKPVYEAVSGNDLAKYISASKALAGDIGQPPIDYYIYIPIAIIIGLLLRLGWLALLADIAGLYIIYDTYQFMKDMYPQTKPGIGLITSVVLLIVLLIVIIDKEEIL